MKPEECRHIFSLIRLGEDRKENEAIRLIYAHYTGFTHKFKWEFSLTDHEITEALDESILRLFKVVRNDTFRGEASCDTFFYEIFRNKCTDLIRKRASKRSKLLEFMDGLELPEKVIRVVSQVMEEKEIAERLKLAISRLKGRNCQGILTDFYYYNFSMEGICEKYGYKNPNAANTKKNECMNELRKFFYQTLNPNP